MKKLLLGAVALGAIAATPAAAQTSESHYAGNGNLPFVGNVQYTLTNPGGFGTFLGNAGVALEVGTHYTAEADAPANTTTATPTVDVVFTLTGSVTRDCSFYAGNDAGAQNIDFGVIGVRTGNNENVNDAFEMVGPAVAEIETLTAGCNFNNEVEIEKDNVDGMVNLAAGGYDTNEFQANIPYSVTANWTGVALNAVTTGSPQTLSVSTSEASKLLQQGAWRSAMSIAIVAPAIQDTGLVAGTYTGTTTLTLRAL